MATVQKVNPVVCPQCRAQFTAPVENMINGLNPMTKMAFLQGQFNLAQCPQCQDVFPADVPILYFDLEKELAFGYVPGGLTVSREQQEQAIGQLTNQLMDKLKPEQKKFYLLSPTMFLNRDSMVDAILEKDGITKAMRQGQEAKAKLVEALMQSEDDISLKAKIDANTDQFDREFYEVLTAMMQNMMGSGNEPVAQAFLALRVVLTQLRPDDAAIVDEIDAELGLTILKGPRDLIQRLQAAESQEAFLQLVMEGYGMLDYTFFQEITAQVDQLTKAGNMRQAELLIDLRTRILEAKNHLEAQSRQQAEKSSKLLEQILKSQNPQKVLADNLRHIDQSFFAVLSSYVEQAQQQGRMQEAQSLDMLGQMAMLMMQEVQAQAYEQAAETRMTQL